MLELDPGARGQVRRRAGALDELGQPRDVVGLHVRLEDGDDRHALRLGERDVLVDEVDVRIDDRELRRASCSRADRRRTRSSSFEQLPEEHRLDKLSSDLLNSNVMDRAAQKDALFEAIALMGKAFASPRRLELLDLLAQAPRTVDELARASGQSNANTSQHLQALHAAGMVTRTREGTSVRYALAGDEALRSGWRCATPPSRSSPRSSARHATTSARTSRRSAATS